MQLRSVKDDDRDGLISLIGGIFSEYEGVHLEPDDLDADLQAYASYMDSIDGEGFVVDGDDGTLLACVSYAPLDGMRFQLKRIYLSKDLRGSGMGLKLLHFVEDKARARGASEMELWSDTRFTRAHRFYEREGYVKQGYTRDLNDSSNTTEYCFIKQL
ncbi:GNAT family N-acetyltransferase [Kordiimonas lacus]|uniref:Putative acetyltransferase n=1 Tax=Kordiimonas lacus TaxID=637679 RepID=A0A1G7C9E6_9PROT|nr:GNAT family N-acetyltransferase [Kordiimonas lacus]SDE36004.1 putative acetyltransferase [Kordiimonas lacus]